MTGFAGLEDDVIRDMERDYPDPPQHKVVVGRGSRDHGGWYAACQNCSWGAWSPFRWYVRLKATLHGERV